MYQFMMLPGTKSASQSTVTVWGFDPLPVLPRCFGKYRFQNEHFFCAEIEEIVTGNNTMTHEEYLDCRALHLTVETFHNDSIFLDLAQFLGRQGIKRSEFIEAIRDRVFTDAPGIQKLYEGFRKEEQKNTWESYDMLDAFLRQDGCIDKYISGEYGTNELYKYRALAVFEHLPALHDLAYGAAYSLLAGYNRLTDEAKSYLSELKEFSLLRKLAPLDTKQATRRVFHYDFPALLERMFEADPAAFRFPDGVEIEILHTDQQRELIEGYIKQYTTTLIGLGRILLRANMNRLYRTARKVIHAESFA